MLVSVRPGIDRGATRVSMVVLGRTPEDIDEFMEKLEATGAFEKILPRQMDKTDEGLNRAVLDSVYTPEQAEAKPAEMRSRRAAKARRTTESRRPGEAEGPVEDGQSRQAGSQARCNVEDGGTSWHGGVVQTKLAEAKS